MSVSPTCISPYIASRPHPCSRFFLPYSNACKRYYSGDGCSGGDKYFFPHGKLESILEEVINAICLTMTEEDESADHGQLLFYFEGLERPD